MKKALEKISKLEAARYAAGLSREELARIIGATGVSVKNWEKGITKPNPKFIPALAKTLNISPDKLVSFITA